jgi:hypothetical protein
VIRAVLLGLVLSGCAGGHKSARVDATRSNEPRPGADKAHPLQRCHLTHTDYTEIADTTCGDGSHPLNGDLQAAHDSREGNVGAGSDGHIVDAYLVPCKPAPRRVYVDAYHCPPGMDPEFHFDAKNPTPEQLIDMGRMLMRFDRLPPDDKSNALRKQSIGVLQTLPVQIRVCGNFLMPAVKAPNYPHASLLALQLVISTGAATLLHSGEKDDPLAIELDTAASMLRFYETMLQTVGESARSPHLDKLLDERKRDTLRARIVKNHCQGGT